MLSSHASCERCSAKIKNNSLNDKDILKNIIKKNNNYIGNFINPFSDKIYNCTIKTISENHLQVNVNLLFPFFGRSQKWIRYTE